MVVMSVKLGIPGLSVPQGTHLCASFRGSGERDGIMLSFLREGLRPYVPSGELVVGRW